MKLKQIIVALCVSGFAMADPVVVVTSPTNISVDGVECGKPMDAIRNRPELASAIQNALEAYCASLSKAKAEVEAKLSDTVTAQAALVKAAQEAIASDKSADEKLVALGEVLKQAGMTIVEREKAKLAAEAEALEKQLAEKRAAIEAVK